MCIYIKTGLSGSQCFLMVESGEDCEHSFFDVRRKQQIEFLDRCCHINVLKKERKPGFSPLFLFANDE